MQYPKAGPNSVGEYQISGLPFATGSLAVTNTTPTRVDFPYVTNHFHVRNLGANPVFIGFTANGVAGTNRYTIPSGANLQETRIRVKSLYLLGSGGATTVDILAGLTFVEPQLFPTLTASMSASNNSQWGYPGVG